MILNRIGSKAKIASKIIEYFPHHDAYIELFFGAGGLFFNKPKVKYNFLNDIDSNVINCFDVLMNQKQELYEYIEMMPIHQELWDRGKKQKDFKTDVEKCAIFLLLSNFSYMGQSGTLRFLCNNTKSILLSNIEKTYKVLVKNGTFFLNCDFREVLKKIAIIKEPLINRDDTAHFFAYADPPYLGTTDNYSASFKEQDCIDLFNLLIDSKMRFAISEFNNPVILELAEKYSLNVIEIGERRTLKSRATEILIPNYKTENKLF